MKNLEMAAAALKAVADAAEAERKADYRSSVAQHEALVAIHKREALIDRAVRDSWPEDADFRMMPRSGVSWNGGFKIRDWVIAVNARFFEISGLERVSGQPNSNWRRSAGQSLNSGEWCPKINIEDIGIPPRPVNL